MQVDIMDMVVSKTLVFLQSNNTPQNDRNNVKTLRPMRIKLLARFVIDKTTMPLIAGTYMTILISQKIFHKPLLPLLLMTQMTSLSL